MACACKLSIAWLFNVLAENDIVFSGLTRYGFLWSTRPLDFLILKYVGTLLVVSHEIFYIWLICHSIILFVWNVYSSVHANEYIPTEQLSRCCAVLDGVISTGFTPPTRSFQWFPLMFLQSHGFYQIHLILIFEINSLISANRTDLGLSNAGNVQWWCIIWSISVQGWQMCVLL